MSTPDSNGAGCARLELTGEIDAATIVMWQRRAGAILEQRPHVLLVDMTAVTFMDSSGLGLLVRLYHEFEVWGGSVKLLRPGGTALRALQVSGLAAVLQVTDALPEEPASRSSRRSPVAGELH